jgi:hypothetical protein
MFGITAYDVTVFISTISGNAAGISLAWAVPTTLFSADLLKNE